MAMALIRVDVVILAKCALVLAFLYLWRWRFYQQQRYPFPRLGKGFLRPWVTWETPTRLRLDHYAVEGYRKFSKVGEPFVIRCYGLDNVILPTKYLSALRSADRFELNFAKHFSDSLNMEASVGDIGTSNTIEIDLVSQQLNPRLAQLISPLSDEADFAVAAEVGNLPGWKRLNVYNTCNMLVQRVVNRVIVGPKLCRDTQYIEACNKYATTSFISGTLWNFMLLGPFRNFLYWLVSFKHRWDLKAATQFIVPSICKRLCGEEKEDDAIQWGISMAADMPDESDPARHANRILHLNFAAVNTTASLIENLIWQTLLYPQFLEPMREEIAQMLESHGGWTEKALNGMILFDSFIRETLRMYPPSVFACSRTILGKPYDFGDKIILQPGSRIMFPTRPVHLDPDNYDQPDVFQGFRFANKGQAHEERLTASTINEKYLPFGYGRQACPGRFLAIRNAKLIFGRLIKQYDFEWVRQPVERPRSMVIEGVFVANLETDICWRNRRI